MIAGVGIDILHLGRLRALVERRSLDKLAKRILSPQEATDLRRLCGSTGALLDSSLSAEALRFLAVRSVSPVPTENPNGSGTHPKLTQVELHSRFSFYRWTTKEAAFKALFPAMRITWKDIEVTKVQPDPKPSLRLLRPSSGLRLHMSTTHDGDYVTSIVIAESTP